MIIGAQRAGTSSLYRYLAGHPQLQPSIRKETEYFSREFRLGESWYRSHFPVAAPSRITFEATPDYLCFPGAAKRAARLVPQVRLIATLRNPVERAWSHYHHMVRLGFETLSFEEALDAEDARIAADLTAIEDSMRRPNDFLRFNYAYRGLYAEQLTRWINEFDTAQLHVVVFEQLVEDPGVVLGGVTDFLDVESLSSSAWTNRSYRAGARSERTPMADATRADLQQRFMEPNMQLASLLGWEELPPGW